MKILLIADTLRNYQMIKGKGKVPVLKGTQSANIIRNLVLSQGYDVLDFKDIETITDHFAYIVYGSLDLDQELKVKNYTPQILRALSTVKTRYNMEIRNQE